MFSNIFEGLIKKVKDLYIGSLPWSGYIMVALSLGLALITKTVDVLAFDPMAIFQSVLATLLGLFGINSSVTVGKKIGSTSVEGVAADLRKELGAMENRLFNATSQIKRNVDGIRETAAVATTKSDAAADSVTRLTNENNTIKQFIDGNIMPAVNIVAQSIKAQQQSTPVAKPHPGPANNSTAKKPRGKSKATK